MEIRDGLRLQHSDGNICDYSVLVRAFDFSFERYYADCKFEKISKTAQDVELGKEFMEYTIEKVCERLPQHKEDFKKYLNKEKNSN